MLYASHPCTQCWRWKTHYEICCLQYNAPELGDFFPAIASNFARGYFWIENPLEINARNTIDFDISLTKWTSCPKGKLICNAIKANKCSLQKSEHTENCLTKGRETKQVPWGTRLKSKKKVSVIFSPRDGFIYLFILIESFLYLTCSAEFNMFALPSALTISCVNHDRAAGGKKAILITT